MNKPVRFLILVVISISLGGVIYRVAETLWLQKVMEIKQNPTKLLDMIPQPALHIKKFRRSKVVEGRKIWELTGEEAVYLKENQEAMIQAPRLTFYHESGEPIEVSGEWGRLFLSGREIERIQLKGGVEVHYKGFVLETAEITYIQKQDLVVSQGKVVMKGNGLELEGVGAEISLNNGTIKLRNKVQSRIEPDLLDGKKIRTG